MLAAIPVGNEHQGAPGFNKNSFAGWTTDASKCDTSERVLIRDSTTAVKKNKRDCTINSGTWLSVFDQVSTTDPQDLIVVQLVSPKEAWESGAWSWSQQRRDAFANDTSDRRTLSVMTRTLNTVRGDKDPANWLPPASSQVCRYVSEWLSVKARWGLSMDQAESNAISTTLANKCPGLIVAAWPIVT